jgi:hypothetical protein
LLSREGRCFSETCPGRKKRTMSAEHARIVPGTKYVLPDDPAYSDLETMRNFVCEVWKTRRQG